MYVGAGQILSIAGAVVLVGCASPYLADYGGGASPSIGSEIATVRSDNVASPPNSSPNEKEHPDSGASASVKSTSGIGSDTDPNDAGDAVLDSPLVTEAHDDGSTVNPSSEIQPSPPDDLPESSSRVHTDDQTSASERHEVLDRYIDSLGTSNASRSVKPNELPSQAYVERRRFENRLRRERNSRIPSGTNPLRHLEMALSTPNGSPSSGKDEPHEVPDHAAENSKATLTHDPSSDHQSVLQPTSHISPEDTKADTLQVERNRGLPEAKGRSTNIPESNSGIDPNSDSEWRVLIRQAIVAMDASSHVQAPGDSVATLNEDVYRRMLQLILNERENVEENSEGAATDRDRFWKHLVDGLSVYLDPSGIPIDSRRAAMALRQLRQANHELAASGMLDLQNVHFCSNVHGYGQYETLPKYEFASGEKLGLYVEVENFKSLQTDEGYRTELRGSYQILDATGQELAYEEFNPAEEFCRNRRRDFFVLYQFHLPRHIAPGDYILKLIVEDTIAEKFGQTAIRFSIAS